MNRAPLLGLASLAIFLATSACVTKPGVTPSAETWQFAGTVFALDGQQVGAPVAGAQLAVTQNDEIKVTTTTDASGHYAFNDLAAGRFTLTISAPGFVTLTPAVNLDRNMRADFALTRR